MENSEITNNEELIKQNNEFIRNSKSFIEVDIVIGQDEEQPVLTNCNIHGVGPQEIAKMILSLRSLASSLENQYPLAKIMSNFMHCKSEKM